MLNTSTVEFRSRERVTKPIRENEYHLDAPLDNDEQIKGPMIIRLLPVAFAVLIMVMMVLMFTMMGRQNPRMMLMMLMMPMMMIMGFFGMTMHGSGAGGSSMAEIDQNRSKWMLKLGELRKSVQKQGRAIHDLMVKNYPNPQGLTSLTAYNNMWQVRRRFADRPAMEGDDSNLTDMPFLTARAGVGMVELEPSIKHDPQEVSITLEPVTAGAFGRFLRIQRAVTNAPIGIRLDEESAYGMRGDSEELRLNLSRAMLVSLAHNHTPNELLLGVVRSESVKDEWEWMKWLPHSQNTLIPTTGGSPQRRLAWKSLEEMSLDLSDDIAKRHDAGYDGPHLIVFVDTPDQEAQWPQNMRGKLTGVTLVVTRCTRDHVSVWDGKAASRLRVEDDGFLTVPKRHRFLKIDKVSVRHAENFARQMSKFRPLGYGTAEAAVEDDVVSEVDDTLPTWFDVLNINDIEKYDPREVWKRNSLTETFRIPIGYKFDGKRKTRNLAYIDFIETARDGTGPHGCAQGKTGTGKSYLLNNIVLTLCATYGPDKISFILADFKGGSAFDGFEDIPHVIACLTNLEEERELVDRAGDVIDGEMERRERFLRQHQCKDILAYREKMKNDPSLEPLADLLIIADEFHEFMIGNRPYLKLFTRVGAKGRSLGMHIIPCSQFIDAGLLADLMNHLTFGISLTAATQGQSRAVLDGDPSAAQLPSGRGHAMIRYVDPESQTNKVDTFVGFSIEDPYVTRTRTASEKKEARKSNVNHILPFDLEVSSAVLSMTNDTPSKTEVENVEEVVKTHTMTQKQALIAHLTKFDEYRPRQLWQPSLTQPMTLYDTNPGQFEALRNSRGVNIRIGDLDDPHHHSRPAYVVPLRTNIAISGSSGVGKSLTLMTMIASTGVTYRDLVNWYLIDFSSGCGSVENYPNVGGYATKNDTDTIERFIGEFYRILDYRSKKFAERRISRVDDYLDMKRESSDSMDPYNYMVLAIDDFPGLCMTDEDEYRTKLIKLCAEGPRYGLHVVATMSDPMALKFKYQDLFSQNVILRVDDTSKLGSKISSDVKMKMKSVSAVQPGRGIDPSTGLPFVVMVPRLTKIEPVENLPGQLPVYDFKEDQAAHIQELGARLTRSVPKVPEIVVVGSQVSFASVWSACMGVPGFDKTLPYHKRLLPLGQNVRDLSVSFVPSTEGNPPHLMIAGAPKSGRSSTLRTIMGSITAQYSPKEARVILIDPAFSHINEAEHLIADGYMRKDNYIQSAPDDIARVSESIIRLLNKRAPQSGVDARTILERTWFDGPELFVLIDNYTSIMSQQGMSSPLDEIVKHLGAENRGIHLIIATNAMGFVVNTQMNKPMKALMSISTPILMLNGPSTEARVTGMKKKFEERRPGRGELVDTVNSRADLVQVAWMEPWQERAK